MTYRIVAIGASWGGLRAVGGLLAGLPLDFEPAIVVAQHRGTEGPVRLAPSLAARTVLPVNEAHDKDVIEPGHVYLAPPGYHLLVDRGSLALSIDEPERFSRPSIDVLFESVAASYGPQAIGVILTGASDDGARGLNRIRASGGVTVAQEPATAERRRMPEAAIAAGGAHRVLELGQITRFLIEVCRSAA